MPLGNSSPSGYVEQVVVDKRLKRMVMVVTGVPEPLCAIQDRAEVCSTPVVCLATESKEMPKDL